MSIEKRLVRRDTWQEAPAGSSAQSSSSGPLRGQASGFAAVAAQADRECKELKDAERELELRKSGPGQ